MRIVVDLNNYMQIILDAREMQRARRKGIRMHAHTLRPHCAMKRASFLASTFAGHWEEGRRARATVSVRLRSRDGHSADETAGREQRREN